MQVNNVSRATAEDFPWAVDGDHWMISIYSSKSAPANITAPFGKIVRLQFDDIEALTDGYQRITAQQAKEIADTIRAAEQQDVKVLWVHCDAGICRSGAVVEAALLRGHTTDDEVSNERVANRCVFNAVRRALAVRHSWETA